MKSKKFPSLMMAAALTLLMFVFAAAPLFGAFSVPEYRNEYGYVADLADVLSVGTINYINITNAALEEVCGAEIVIVTVNFLDGAKVDDYTYRLFEEWKPGSPERNNGILLLLAIGEDDYYAMQGLGLEKQFGDGLVDDYLYEYLEDHFAAGDYDTGVKAFFDACVSRLERVYGVTAVAGAAQVAPSPGSTGLAAGSPGGMAGSGASGSAPSAVFPVFAFVALILILVFVLVIVMLTRLPRYPQSYGPYGYGRRRVFRPIIFGFPRFGRSRWRYRPRMGMPPPRPVRTPRTMGTRPTNSAGRPGGGFSGRSGGGGMTRGGGAGRSSGGSFGGGRSGGSFGGGRSGGGSFGGRSGGGGMTRGGGAGRR